MATKKKMLTAIFRDRAIHRAALSIGCRSVAMIRARSACSCRTKLGRAITTTAPKARSRPAAMRWKAWPRAERSARSSGRRWGPFLPSGTTIWFPAWVWIVAGPIFAALAGGGAGAVTGGAVGGLVGLGIPESNAKAYEEALKKGGVVFGVHPIPARMPRRFGRILKSKKPTTSFVPEKPVDPSNRNTFPGGFNCPFHPLLKRIDRAGFWVMSKKEGKIMSTTGLIILIVVLFLVFGGGGGYWYSRRGL